jgi:hypothetical protein
MHKNATKCNETLGKWCKNKHGALKIIDTFETYQGVLIFLCIWLMIRMFYVIVTLLILFMMLLKVNIVGVLDTGVSRSTCSWAPSTALLRPRGGTTTEASEEDPHEEAPHEENDD